MPPVLIDIRAAEDSRDVVHRAVQALAEGKLVALPTETVYGLAASARHEGAIQQLLDAKHRPQGQPLTLAVKSADDALDYVPGMNRLGRRLARRCWPGPITLVVEDNHPESLIHRLPAIARQAISPTGSLGLRVPAHQTVLDILRMLAGPIALTSANRSGNPDALTAEDVVENLGDTVDLVLNDGRSRLGQPSTVVEVTKDGIEILRAGVVSPQTLKRLSSFMLLLVCTGNTCRSPMAEAISRQLLAERLGCSIDELADRGVIVMSAGTSAAMGNRAAAEAVTVLSKRGMNLAEHESQPVTSQLVRHADVIWAMTRSHRQAIVSQWPEAASRTALLMRDQGDISDPIGGTEEQYERCANQLRAELAARLNDMEI